MKIWVWVILYAFIQSYAIFVYFYTILNTPIWSQAKYLYPFLTQTNVSINMPTSIKACPLSVFKSFIRPKISEKKKKWIENNVEICEF